MSEPLAPSGCVFPEPADRTSAAEPGASGPDPEPAAGAGGARKTSIIRLFEALEAAGVGHCHWKSNIRLDATLAGHEDIDLLVDRRDRDRFHAVLGANGFRLTRSLAGEHPGVFHAVALDQPSAELVHLHVYFQLVSGDSLVKNYRFPVEHQLLARTRRLHGVRVPARDAELLLFVLRIGLKHVSPVEIIKVSGAYAEVVAELRFLMAGGAEVRARALLADWFPTIGQDLFDRLLAALADERAVARRVTLGWALAWRLRHLRRMSGGQAAVLRTRQVIGKGLARVRRRRQRVLLEGGGIVAVVGPKGLGKSTLTREIGRRLGRELAVLPIHAGKPPPTALSAVPRLFVPLARVVLRHERLAEYEKPERRRSNRYSLIYVLRMTLMAYDRRALLFRAMRAATAGTVVVSDRYPADGTGATDSCRFDDDALARCGGSKRRLMAMERRCYVGLPRPRLVLRLVAPLDLAIERDAARLKRGGPDADAVRRRWALETSGRFDDDVPVVEIAANGALEDTARAAVAAIWEGL